MHLFLVRLEFYKVMLVQQKVQIKQTSLWIIFIAENHIHDYERISRVLFWKKSQITDLGFVIREKFLTIIQESEIPTQQQEQDQNFYYNQGVFTSLKQISSLNFIAKIETPDIDLSFWRILLSYRQLLIMFYKVHFFLGQEMSQSKCETIGKKGLQFNEVFVHLPRDIGLLILISVKQLKKQRKKYKNKCRKEVDPKKTGIDKC